MQELLELYRENKRLRDELEAYKTIDTGHQHDNNIYIDFYNSIKKKNTELAKYFLQQLKIKGLWKTS